MVAMPALMTAEDLLYYDAQDKRVELIRGRLVVHEPPGIQHGGLTVKLSVLLSNHLAQETRANGWPKSRGRLAAGDPGFTIERNPDTVRAPDVAYVSREQFAGPLPIGFLELAPDLAIEVRSPGDRAGEIAIKVGHWLTAGSKLVWSVNPARAQVTVYRADGSVSVLDVGDTLDGETVLPGFVCPLTELFADD